MNLKALFAVAATLWLSACSVARLPESINTAIVNNADLDTVEAGLPTYLLTLDGLVENYPDNVGLLHTSSSLYGAYATLFVEDPDRRKMMVDKAYQRASKAYCVVVGRDCDLKALKYDAFEAQVVGIQSSRKIDALYRLGSSWLSVIQENADDWNAIADLAKVQRIMEAVVAFDASHDRGQALLYLGVMNTLIPPSLGGKPDVALAYFEQAIAVSEGRNLIVQVFFARHYARLIFDQELHDRLLTEVITADAEEQGLWLQNVYAQKLAKQLLAESADYF